MQLSTVPLMVGALWTLMVLTALLASDLSASAGIMQGFWTVLAFGGGLAMTAAVYVAVIMLPETWPRIVRRLILIFGMGGAFWGVGTLTRAAYALTL